MNELNMTVIEAKCTRTHQLFGISFKEVKPNEWVAYWTFPLSEVTSRKEGFGNAAVTGVISLDNKYPGCPHCKAGTFLHCSVCHKVYCCIPGVVSEMCPWCGANIPINYNSTGHYDIAGGTDG
jgi:hypothetical protein